MAENKENYKPEWTPDGAGSEFASSVMPGIEGSGVQETAPRPFSRKQMSVEEYVQGVLSGNRRILAQAITIVESNSEKHFALAAYWATKRAWNAFQEGTKRSYARLLPAEHWAG